MKYQLDKQSMVLFLVSITILYNYIYIYNLCALINCSEIQVFRMRKFWKKMKFPRYQNQIYSQCKTLTFLILITNDDKGVIFLYFFCKLIREEQCWL